MLSPRLQLKVSQKQILTPGLVQMVTVLQLNRLELKDMITQEIAENPVLEETADGVEELTPEEVQSILERERESEPSDQTILETVNGAAAPEVEAAGGDFEAAPVFESDGIAPAPAEATATATAPEVENPDQKTEKDPFDEIDFGTFFDEYLDPGYKSPASESVEKPSFETFLSSPVTLADHLHSQLSVLVMPDEVRDAAANIIGNLDENGYLTATLEEIAETGQHTAEEVNQGLRVVQSLDPAGVGAKDVRECLLLQLESRNGRGGVAWQIVSNHLKLVETRQLKEIAKQLGRPLEHVQIALAVIRHLDPYPGLRYSGPGARQVEPDVYIFKEGDEYIIQLNDDDLPQLRLNAQYRKMLDRDQEPSKEIRNYVKDRYAAAIQLIKNIEQRKQTILKVCQSIVRRQLEFLGARHRSAQTDDDQGSGRGDWRTPLDCEPCGCQQVRRHAPGRVRAAVLLLRSRSGHSRKRYAVADLETSSQEDDRRRRLPTSAHRRADHGAAQGGRYRRHSQNGCQIP